MKLLSKGQLCDFINTRLKIDITDLLSKFIKLVQKEIKVQEDELIEEELIEKKKLYSPKPIKGPKGLSQALAING